MTKSKNLYNGKLTLAGESIKIKLYDSLQVRKRKKNSDNRYEILELENNEFSIYDYILEKELTLDEFFLSYLQKKISPKEYNKILTKLEYLKKTQFQKKIENKLKTLKRLRENIKDLINANLTRNVKFLTLTFEENITDVKTANYEFKKFILRLKHHTKKDVKYISILEAQQRGAIHYHILLFDFVYLPWEEYKELWKLGSVNIQSLLKNGKKLNINCENGSYFVENEKIKDLASYLSKITDYVVKTLKSIENIKTYEDLEKLEKSEDREKYLFVFQENIKLINRSRNLKAYEVAYIFIEKAFFEELKEKLQTEANYFNTFHTSYVITNVYLSNIFSDIFREYIDLFSSYFEEKK